MTWSVRAHRAVLDWVKKVVLQRLRIVLLRVEHAAAGLASAALALLVLLLLIGVLLVARLGLGRVAVRVELPRQLLLRTPALCALELG